MNPVTCYRWKDAARVAWTTGRATLHKDGRWNIRRLPNHAQGAK